MGIVNSRPGEEAASTLYLRDQNRLSISSVTITNGRGRTVLTVSPNSFPATRYIPRKDIGDDSLIEYVQDPESISAGGPSFLLRLPNEDELNFAFTFVVRQPDGAQAQFPSATNAQSGSVDSSITGLTFAFASTSRDLENLVTREFQTDPNLHKNPNVHLVGDYTTSGHSSVQFNWSWKWKPPKSMEDRGGGWRTCCSFVEYDQRAHRLDTLASFAFWVYNSPRPLGSPKVPSPRLEASIPQRLRVPSTQSIESRVSDSDGAEYKDLPEPKSPGIEPIPENGLGLVPSLSGTTATTAGVSGSRIDVTCQRPGEDLSAVEDGPLFRATMKSMEQRTGNIRASWKKVLKAAEALQDSAFAYNSHMAKLMEALREASSTNATAVQPAFEHYFDTTARAILEYQKEGTHDLQKLIIDPISKLYNNDIKQAEAKKKDFEEESNQYYSYVSRYLGQRQDSLKEKKRAETDSKYQNKRRLFELKRFDYSNFMQDLHGGRKNQEVLSHLTRYADAQARGFLRTAKKIETNMPQLEALTNEVKEADKSFQIMRTEREEKRRTLEKSSKMYREPDAPSAMSAQPTVSSQANGGRPGMNVASNPEASASTTSGSISNAPITTSPPPNGGLPVPSSVSQVASTADQPAPVGSPSQNKFKGIRDLEEKNFTGLAGQDGSGGQHRKEGLLWALSRPGSHIDPKGLNKQAWHKFWVVLDQGKLSEYTNWKQKLDLHNDPIDLRVASVREARNAERRFCLEVITPQYTRVYQATSEEDMKSWILAINNALQSAMEGKGVSEPVATESLPGSTRRDIASVLTGKSTSLSTHKNPYAGTSTSKTPSRHLTVGDRPSYRSSEANDEYSAKLLQQIRDADAGNAFCADCGSDTKVEWVSINLGIVMCIECSGIHRSLGTHISKVRSLTLDTTSFTPDAIELLLTIGNRVSNMVWEAKLAENRSLKPTATSTREQRLRFITAKYADRAFVQPISPTLSHYSTPDETLLASIKKNDIHNVLYALALRANPNATDRSRATHAVFLALAAADPASPASAAAAAPSSSSPAHSPAGSSHSGAGPPPPTPQGRKPFPLAELLLQNGADLPAQPAPIPLSPAAKLYLEQKAEQRAGKGRSRERERGGAGGGAGAGGGYGVSVYGGAGAGAGAGAGPATPTGGDLLAPLPPGVGAAATAATGSDGAGGLSPGPSPGGAMSREREAKLQKRVSAGGRLVRNVDGAGTGMGTGTGTGAGQGGVVFGGERRG
ncbi:centaurin-beta-2 [Lineolata rhizophorae]|uniref:ADP-ribosylation factor GTPase-activating protein n=1 Tax=Lineolata rhizophorae TaxID=578093 RepID=A0A6A6NL90_9PEZI|nr:centaurin-beta-2 [Lineolata rhizophorae]